MSAKIFVSFVLASLILTLAAAGKDEMDRVASEFRGIARADFLERRIDESLEDHERWLGNAVKGKRISESDAKRARRILDNVGKMRLKMLKAGKADSKEAGRISRELAKASNVIWFAARKSRDGKPYKFMLFGRALAFKPWIQEKADRNALSHEMMGKIRLAWHRAWRAAEMLKDKKYTDDRRLRLQREAFLRLADYCVPYENYRKQIEEKQQ